MTQARQSRQRQPRCGSCGIRPVGGTVICRPCTVRLETALITIATLAPDIDIALARQAKFGGGGSRGSSTEPPLLFDDMVSETAWVVRTTLIAWCTELTEPGDTPAARHITNMALWLLRRIPRIVVHDAAGTCCDEIGDAAQQAMKAVDRPPERRYAGPCPDCGRALYAKPGRNTATCRDHEPPLTVTVDDRREWMLGEAAAVLAHAAGAVRLLAVLEIPITPVQVTRWAKAGRLTQHGTDPNGRTLYRIGDLIELAATRARPP